jgi:hypothetical protein
MNSRVNETSARRVSNWSYNMIWISRLTALAAGAFTLAGCEAQQLGGDDMNVAQQQEATAGNVATANIQPPPMVTRSASYRCDDGKALYVDILTDENIVNVGEGRTLSGRGDEVNYTAPGRANQTCRAGGE